MFRKKNNLLDADLLMQCVFEASAMNEEPFDSLEEVVKALSAQTIADMKNVNPKVRPITEQEAEAEEVKTVIAIRSFATHEDSRIFAGKDVYMKLNKDRWVQATKDGRSDYNSGRRYIPNAKFGYYTLNGELGVIQEVEHELIVFLRKDD